MKTLTGSKKQGIFKRFSKLTLTVSLIVLAVALVALITIGLVKFGSAFAFAMIFWLLVKKIASLTGMNIWLVRAMALPIAALVVYTVCLMFSWHKANRRTGRIIFISLMIASCLAMFAITKDTYFDFQTGTAQKWYAATPEGYRLFDASGFDPKYGITLKQVTPYIQRQIENWKREPGRIRVPSGQEETYFDMITGEPLQWYYRLADGKYEFFSKPGYHPTYGEPLKPATPDMVKEIETKSLRIESEKAKLEQEKAELQERIKQLQTEFARDGQELERALRTAQQEVDSLQTKNTSLIRERKIAGGDKSVLQKKVSSLRREIKEFKKKISTLKTKNTFVVESLNKKISDLNAQLQPIEKQLRVVSKERDKLKAMMNGEPLSPDIFYEEDFSRYPIGQMLPAWGKGIVVLGFKKHLSCQFGEHVAEQDIRFPLDFSFEFDIKTRKIHGKTYLSIVDVKGKSVQILITFGESRKYPNVRFSNEGKWSPGEWSYGKWSEQKYYKGTEIWRHFKIVKRDKSVIVFIDGRHCLSMSCADYNVFGRVEFKIIPGLFIDNMIGRNLTFSSKEVDTTH